MNKLLVAMFLLLLAACSGSSVGNSPNALTPIARGISPAVQTPPPAGWQFPYVSNPFIVPICKSDPCTPQLDPNSASEVSEMMHAGFSLGEIQEAQPGTIGQGQGDTDPVYYASQSDPSYKITCSQYGGCSYFSGVSVHIPNGAYASIDVDHHLTVVQQWSGNEYDFWEFNDNGTGVGSTKPVYGGGSVSVAYGGICTTTSLENEGHCTGGAVESNMPLQPGMLDPREIVAGAIAHTVYAGVSCPSPKFVWPASGTNGTCPSGPEYGERVWLDLPDAAIDALPDHAWAKTILHQMHDYGITLATRCGGCNAWSILGLDNATFTIVGEQPAWNAFFTEVEQQGDGSKIGWGDDASHLYVPATGITQSNIHIVE